MVPGLKLLAGFIFGLDAILLVLWRPDLAPTIGLFIPLAPLVGASGTQALYGGILILGVAAARSWPSAHWNSRRGSALIFGLGLATMFIATLITSTAPTDSGGDIVLIYTVALGSTTAITNPSPQIVVGSVAALGAIAALAAVSTPHLIESRTTTVLGTNANGIGFLAALGAVAALCTFWSSVGLVRIGAAVVAVLCAIGVFNSGSRGGLILALAGCTFLLLHRAIGGPLVRAAVTVVALGTTLTLLAPTVFDALLGATGRLQRSAEASIGQRKSALQYAIHQGFTHPWTGVGIGRLPEISHDDPNSGLGLSAHNAFAAAFAESGLIPLTCLVSLCVLALLRARSFEPVYLLPLVVGVLVGGVSLQWWGDGATGPVAFVILGAAVALNSRCPRRGGDVDAHMSTYRSPSAGGQPAEALDGVA